MRFHRAMSLGDQIRFDRPIDRTAVVPLDSKGRCGICSYHGQLVAEFDRVHPRADRVEALLVWWRDFEDQVDLRVRLDRTADGHHASVARIRAPYDVEA